MSRTYHHGDKAKMCLFENATMWGECPHRWRREEERGQHPKRKRHTDRWNWMSTPSWWIREMMTVSQRAQVRQLAGRTLKLFDVEEAPLFPLAKKPHHYFW